MIVNKPSKRQATSFARVLDAQAVGRRDQFEQRKRPDGFTLRPRQIDYSRLGTLRNKIRPCHPPFDVERFRKERYPRLFIIQT